MDEFDSADAIIFGCPTYMGSMAAEMKRFLEAAVKRWFAQAWKDKIAGEFTNSSSFSGDKLNTLTGLVINAMQHGMIYVGSAILPRMEAMNHIEGPRPDEHIRLGSYVAPMAASFQVDPPETPPKGDLETAEAYGKRVAEITLRFVRDRSAEGEAADLIRP